MSYVHRRAGVLLLLLVACEPREQEPPKAPPRLLVVTQLEGVAEPCGCSAKQLGGLDRLVGRIEAKRAQGPSALLLAGDMFWSYEKPPAHLAEQELRRAKLLGTVLTKLQPLTLAAGPIDALHGGMREDEGRLVRVGSLMIGVVSTARVIKCDVLDVRAEALRRGGARLVVGLVGVDDATARTCAGELQKLDVMIAPGGKDVQPPRQLGRLTWLDGGEQGRVLGTLTFHPAIEDPKEWTFFDEGRAARASLDARIERLRQELSELEDADAKRARQSKLTELEAQRATLKAPAPQGSYFTYEVEPITKELPPAPWVKEALVAYNASLCDVTKASTEGRVCTPAPSPGDAYVGSEACRACHAPAFAVYEQSKHARAWATLVDAGKTCDLGCIGCHTVGYEQPGGFCRVADADHWKNVGCESCHGPGKGHVDNPQRRAAWGSRFARKTESATCLTCHNPEHSDAFDFASYLPRILGPGHGAPAGTAK